MRLIRARSSWLLCVLLLICLSLGVSSAAPSGEPTSRWVMGPGAQAGLRAISQEIATAFGWTSAGVAVEGGRVRFRFNGRPPSPSVDVILMKKAPAGRPVLVTRHGMLFLSVEMGAERRGSLQERLNGLEVTLPWKRVGGASRPLRRADKIPVDHAEAQRARDARKGALALRSGRRANALARPDQAPWSRRLAAGDSLGSEWVGLESRFPQRRMKAAMGLIRRHRGEPRLWTIAAHAAMEAGLFDEARSLLDVATRMEVPDEWALQQWAAHTGQVPAKAVGALPGKPDGSGVGGWHWVFMLAALLWWVAMVRFTRERRWVVGALGIVALAAAVLGAWEEGGSKGARGPPLPEPVEALIAPLAGSPCVADPGWLTSQSITYLATCKERPFAFHLRPMTERGAPGLNTPFHTVSVEGADQDDGTEMAAQMLWGAVKRAEAAGFRVAPLALEGPTRDHYRLEAGSLEAGSLALSRAFGIMSWIFALVAFVLALRVLQTHAKADPILLWGLAAILVLHVAWTFALPGRLVMEYTGYDLTARVAQLEATPRYGAGACWLYQPFMAIWGVDHHAMQVANRVFGVLTIVPLTALAFLIRPGRSSLLTPLLFMVLPLFWRDHVSEAIMAGTVWWMVCALFLWVLGCARARPAPYVFFALPLLLAAATSRPEAGPALLIACIGVTFFLKPGLQRVEGAGLAWRPILAVVVLGGVFALVPVAWLWNSMEAQVDEAGILAIATAWDVRLWDIVRKDNLFMSPLWLPAVVPLWFLMALVPRAHRRLVVAFGCAAFAWIAIGAVDLPVVSIPRVQGPAVVLLLPLAGVGLRWAGRWRWAHGIMVAVLVAWVGATGPQVMARSNADEEETLIREAVARLPNDACLVTLRMSDDPPPGHTQRHFPDYLFPAHRVLSLARYDDQARFCKGPSMLLLGTRAYMDFRAEGSAAPQGDGMLASCRHFLNTHPHRPIETWTIPNRTDGTFPMYPAASTLDIGLYELVGAE